MSLLLRRCRFSNYWQYTKFVKSIMICERLHVSSHNLRETSRNARASSNILDDKIRKCLDYLMDEYKNETWEHDRLLDLINLNAIGGLLSERTKLVENIQNLQDLAKQDMEIKALAEEENVLYIEQLNELDERLLDAILVNISKESYDSIIVEVAAGVGGQEAMLFTRDLYEMYMNYAKYLGLDHEVIDIDFTDNNGIKYVSIMVSGEGTSKFRYECGVHRVQRIPVTEKSGRIHTSTASVAITPAPSDVQIVINQKDLKIETKRATGAGGQHVNTTDSAVRLTHMPTGNVINVQVHRSQIKNRELALTKLRSMLYEQQLNKQTSFLSELRKKQMGMGMRNEKVRTYNYNQDRVTDHRLQDGTLHNLKEFMQGGAALEELEDRLYNDIRIKTLMEVMKKLEMQIK